MGFELIWAMPKNHHQQTHQTLASMLMPMPMPMPGAMAMRMVIIMAMGMALAGCSNTPDFERLALAFSPAAQTGAPSALDEAEVDRELLARFNAAHARSLGNRDGRNGGGPENIGGNIGGNSGGGNGGEGDDRDNTPPPTGERENSNGGSEGGSEGDDRDSAGMTNPSPTPDPDGMNPNDPMPNTMPDDMMSMDEDMMSNDWTLGDYQQDYAKYNIPGKMTLNCSGALCPSNPSVTGKVTLTIDRSKGGGEVALNNMDLHKYENGQSTFSVKGSVRMEMPELGSNDRFPFIDNAKADVMLTTPKGYLHMQAYGDSKKDPNITYNTKGSLTIGDEWDGGLISEKYDGQYGGHYKTLPSSQYIDRRHSLGIDLRLTHDGTDKHDLKDDTILFNGFNFPRDPPP